MNKMPIEGRELIKEYVLKYKEQILDGSMSKSGLARIIYGIRPDLFISLEHVKRRVRGYTGSGGRDETNPLFEFKSTIAHGNKSIIPESRKLGSKIFDIVGVKNLLLVSDIHIPYHDKQAVEFAFSHGLENNVDGILLNGDILDMYQVSRWSKDPNAISIREEFEMARDFFRTLREVFPKIPIYFKLGNHEDRWDIFLKTKAPEIFGIEDFSLDEVLKLKSFNIQLVGSKQRIRFGKLNIVHGHEFGESIFSPVNPARGLFLRAKCSTIAGHHHQTSEHHENNLNADSMACFTVGCLCDLEPDYRPMAFTKWNHGFARIELLNAEGTFRVNNYRIINGEVI